MTKRLVAGVGINDAGYETQHHEYYINDVGKKKRRLIWICPYYKKWIKMLYRSCDNNTKSSNLSYKDCSVCEDWKLFSNFKDWVDTQACVGWEDLQLDKDLLSTGDKLYSPETCCLLSRTVNGFLRDELSSGGKYLIGVSPSKSPNYPFEARCRDPFKIRKRYIASYATEIEAHNAWKLRKHQYAMELSELEENPRVREALMCRYL